jgi:hypothetical protein
MLSHLPYKSNSEKISWIGKIISIQPRIRLMRSFDQSAYSYLGYVLLLQTPSGPNNQSILLRIAHTNVQI